MPTPQNCSLDHHDRFDTIRARPAVVRGYAVMEETRKNRKPVEGKTR
jgi:hypothetical protein